MVDILQVPAFLARQTDLLIACGRTGKPSTSKKASSWHPRKWATPPTKFDPPATTGPSHRARHLLRLQPPGQRLHRPGSDEIFRLPVVFDVTHSTQQPAGQGHQSGGNPQFSPLLARAAVAAGVNGLFLECHPDPKNAKSDAATMLDFATVETMLTQCTQIAEMRKAW